MKVRVRQEPASYGVKYVVERRHWWTFWEYCYSTDKKDEAITWAQKLLEADIVFQGST